MQPLQSGDFLRRLRQAGIAGQVQASQVLQAFRFYIESEFPEGTAADIEPLFVRGKELVVRSHNPALMQAVKDREGEITRYIMQATRIPLDQIRFRA